MLYITTGHHASKYKPTAPNYSYRFPVMPRATATTFSVSLKTT